VGQVLANEMTTDSRIQSVSLEIRSLLLWDVGCDRDRCVLWLNWTRILLQSHLNWQPLDWLYLCIFYSTYWPT